MISEIDIYRAANLVIERHGADALIEAARMIDLMLDHGDPEGQRVWQRIRRAIETSQAPASGPPHLAAVQPLVTGAVDIKTPCSAPIWRSSA